MRLYLLIIFNKLSACFPDRFALLIRKLATPALFDSCSVDNRWSLSTVINISIKISFCSGSMNDVIYSFLLGKHFNISVYISINSPSKLIASIQYSEYAGFPVSKV